MIDRSKEPIELTALLWAWTNATGRLPDSNTMSEEEIGAYWHDYRTILTGAIKKLTGKEPDIFLRDRSR